MNLHNPWATALCVFPLITLVIGYVIGRSIGHQLLVVESARLYDIIRSLQEKRCNRPQ